MITKDLKKKAVKNAAALDADCAPLLTNDEAWDRVEVMLAHCANPHDYETTEEAVMDISVTMARVENALAWINEFGDPDHRRDEE